MRRMNSFGRRALFLVLVFSLAIPVFAAKYKIPEAAAVVDQANIINSKDEAAITAYLEQLYQNTGVQLAVLTVKSLNNASLEDYSMAVAEEWKLGKKDTDSGVLLLVAMNEHALRIEVGYGLEGSLTDAQCGLIIRRVITPYFKNGDYSTGIVAGVESIAQQAAGSAAGTVSGATKARTLTAADDDDDSLADLIPVVFMLIFIIVSLASSRRNTRRYGAYGRSSGGLLRNLFWLNMLNNSSHHSSGGNHTTFNGNTFPGNSFRGSGFGGGNSFGGGGFHGGGGRFGGGGASGHW